MSAKQINVDLIFNADTQAAKRNLEDLKTSLNTLQSINIGGFMTSGLKEASTAAQQLQGHLANAFNIKTGNIDINKLKLSLQQSGQTAQQLGISLLKAGQQGEQAFLQFNNAILNSKLQIIQTQSKLAAFGTSLKNIMAWNIGSKIINGFTNGIREAISYTQSLDSSLTDIGVVTGYSVDKMAEFANQANKAAKELKTTTNEYAKASLIYYQQGLSGDDVLERTDTTMKLANVTGQSAQEVSQWMTAIWNNYDDGSKSLESYADIITKLGAKTASSSEEIATGMEKFMAIGQTVGLSYENAAAALATVTATTRQSADVVGTAFKTLFSRMEQLKLGETLDDGTTLGQYSQALEKVGVNIKTTSGELKDMDDIIAETGERWKGLGRDQQVALAQSVAGIRQYQQFIALMDHFDFYKENLDLAQNGSEGELERQQKRWEEGWEAASQNVKSSTENLWNNLIPKEGIIDLTNAFADIVDFIANLTKSFGGFKNILLLIMNILISQFQPQIAQTFNDIISKFSSLSTFGTVFKNSFITPIKEGIVATKDLVKTYSGLKQVSGLKTNLNESQNKIDTLTTEKTSIADKSVSRTPDNNLEYQITKDSQKPELSIEEAVEKTNQVNEKIIEQENIQANLKDKIVSKQDSLTKAIEHTNEREKRSIENQEALTKDVFLTTDSVKQMGNYYQLLSDNFKSQLKTQEDIYNYTNKFSILSEKMTKDEKQKADLMLKELQTAGELQATLKGQEQQQRAVLETARFNTNIDIMKMDTSTPDNPDSFSYVAQTDQAQDFLMTTERINALEEQGLMFVQDKQGLLTIMTDSEEEMVELQANEVSNLQELTGLEEKIAQLKVSENLTEEEKQEILTQIRAELEENSAVSEEEKEYLLEQIDTLGAKEDGLNQILKMLQQESNNTKIILKALGATDEQIEDIVSKSQQLNKTVIARTSAEQQYGNKLKSLNGLLDGIKDRSASIGTIITQGVSSISRMFMGVSQLSNAFQDFDATSLSSWSSLLMGASMTLSAFLPLLNQAKNTMTAVNSVLALTNALQATHNGQTSKQIITEALKNTVLAEGADLTDAETQANLKKQLIQKLGITTDQAEILSENLINAAKEEGIGLNGAKVGAITAETTAKIAETGANNSLAISEMAVNFWTLLIIASLLVLIAIIAIVVSAINAKSKAEDAALEGTVENEKANQELIKTYQELSSEISNLIDEYKKLKESGEDVTETVEKLKEKIPELIDNLKELDSKNLPGLENLSSDIANLQGAFETASVTGDFDQVTKIIEDIDPELKYAQTQSQASGAKAAGRKMWKAASDGFGGWSDNTFTYSGGSTTWFSKKQYEKEKASQDVLMKYLDPEFVTQNSSDDLNWETSYGIKVDLSNDPMAAVRAYDQINDALTEMEKNGQTDTEAYREMSLQIEEMGDYIDEAREQAEAYEASVLDSVNANEDYGLSLDDIKNKTDKYKNAIADLKEKYNLSTDAEAEDILNKSNQMANATAAITKIDNSTATDEVKKNLRDIYDNLSEEDKKLFLSVDLNTNQTEEQIKEKIAELRKTANINHDIEEATAVDSDVTEDQVKAYAESLGSLTGAFKDNKEAATQAAAVNIKFQKGMESAAKVWKDSVKIIKEGNKASFEYSEALGKLKTELQKAFGVELSNAFIENKENMEELEKVMNGDLSTMDKLQKAAAQDYVAHMDLQYDDKTTLDEVKGWRQQIQEMISSIDTSINLGENITVDPKYIETLQSMLDAGAMTEDQLKNIFNSMGVVATYSYTDKWIDGPEEIIAKYTTDENGKNKSKTTYEHTQKKMKVPQLFVDGKPATDLQISKGSSPSTISGSSISNASGGSSSKEDKSLDKESERYHVINKQIDSTTKAYDRLSKAKDKAYGKDKLKLIDQMIAKNDKLIAQEQEKARQIEANLSKDAGLMKGYGAQFDEYGNITNYDQLVAGQVAKYNSSKSDDAEKAYTAFTDALKQYEDTLNEYQDIQDTITEKTYQALDLKLEKIDYEVQLKIDIDDRDLEYIEYQLERIEDKAFSAAETIALMSQSTEKNLSKIAAYQQGIKDILQTSGASMESVESFLKTGDMSGLMGLQFTEEQINKLKDYSDELLNLNKELEDTRKNIHEELMKDFDETNEKFDDYISNIEHLTNTVQNYKDIIDLVGKDTLGISDQLLKDINDSLVQTAKGNLEATRNKKETIEAELKSAEESLAKAQTEEDKKLWEDNIKQIKEELNAAEEEFQESWKSALEVAADAFKNNVELIMEAFNQSVSGIYANLDTLSDAFEKQKSNNELYLQDYKKMYETNKLIRDINKQIDSTDNIKAKQELANLSGDIAEYQKDGKKMSDYDLQYLQKKYDLLVAQQALEDARNAKNTVRLQRDSSGNYGYVYTADETKTAEAQQKVEDAQYGLDELNYNHEVELNDKRIQLLQDYKDQYLNIQQDVTLSAEERQQKLEQLDNYFAAQQEQIFYDYNNLMERAGLTFEETLFGQMYPDYNSFYEAEQATSEQIETMQQEVEKGWNTYQENVQEIFNTAGTDVGNYKDRVAEELGQVREENDKTVQSTDNLKTQAEASFKGATDAINTWQLNYSNKIDLAISKNNELYNNLSSLITKYNGVATAANNAAAAIAQEAAAKSNSVGGGGGSTLQTEQNPPPQTPSTPTMHVLTSYAASNGQWMNINGDVTDESGNILSGKGRYQKIELNGRTFFKSMSSEYWYDWNDMVSGTKDKTGSIRRIAAGRSSRYKYYKQGGLVSYTGPAWVDGTPQTPEAFLNPEQTQLIGTLAAALTANTNVASKGLNLSAFGLTPNYNQQPIQQDVTIHAEFPNATDHTEIEEAFNTLVNRASQYINRKNI